MHWLLLEPCTQWSGLRHLLQLCASWPRKQTQSRKFASQQALERSLLFEAKMRSVFGALMTRKNYWGLLWPSMKVSSHSATVLTSCLMARVSWLDGRMERFVPSRHSQDVCFISLRMATARWSKVQHLRSVVSKCRVDMALLSHKESLAWALLSIVSTYLQEALTARSNFGRSADRHSLSSPRKDSTKLQSLLSSTLTLTTRPYRPRSMAKFLLGTCSSLEDKNHWERLHRWTSHRARCQMDRLSAAFCLCSSMRTHRLYLL